MPRVLLLTIVLLSLSEVLLVHWALLAMRGEGLTALQSLVGGLGLGVLNWNLFPLARQRIHATGLPLAFSRSWIMGSVATLWTGLGLGLVFGLVVGGGWLIGAPDAGRAAFVGLGGAVVMLGYSSVLWGATVGNERIRVDAVSLPIANLPDGLRSLRIAHITDLHIGSLMRPMRLRAIVQRVNELGSDLIVITGDIFDFDPRYIEEGCRELAKLDARLGVFAVLGNHDHYTGTEAVVSGLRELTSIRLLRDEWESIEQGGDSLALAGLEDPQVGWADKDCTSIELEELALGIPEHLPRVLLAHRPSFFEQAANLGFDVILSGHTHGGQVALPLAQNTNPARIISRWTRGTFMRSGSTLYVNRGVGMAGLPLRINCPREIALIRFDG